MNDVAHAGQTVLSLALVLGLVACLAFQWNNTHVFNPVWHPHARFHAVQLCLFFVVLFAGGLWMTWRRSVPASRPGSPPEFPSPFRPASSLHSPSREPIRARIPISPTPSPSWE